MCGRYFIDEGITKEIRYLVGGMSQPTQARWYHSQPGSLEGGGGSIRSIGADIYPSSLAPVITGGKSSIRAEEMKWGFIGSHKKLLINARAETALERPFFSECIRHQRCIVVARHFYEWDADKNKVTFYHPSKQPIFMAGFCQCAQDGMRFIILTTEANASVQPVHGRMPLILEGDEIWPWILDGHAIAGFLGKIPPQLDHKQEYEQLAFFYNQTFCQLGAWHWILGKIPPAGWLH